jgi:predicted nucleic acid-binding protein
VIVLDTSFLVAFHNERDTQHAKALAAMERFLNGTWGTGLLLEYVFLEVVTVLMVRRDVSVASRVGSLLLEAAELELVPCSDIFQETVKAFGAQKHTRLSFADTAIAVVATARADSRILTFDEEFRKLSAMQLYPG